MNEMKNALDIAVLKEQITGLREQQRAHNENTQTRLNRIENKLESLFEVLNKGKGAYAASFVIAGIIGAFIVKVGAFLIGLFGRSI